MGHSSNKTSVGIGRGSLTDCEDNLSRVAEVCKVATGRRGDGGRRGLGPRIGGGSEAGLVPSVCVCVGGW